MAESEVEEPAFLETGDFNTHLRIKVGQHMRGPDSFFHTFAQGLAKLGTTVSVQELRNKCKELAEDDPPSWFMKSLAHHEFFENSVSQDDVNSYIEGISNDGEGQPAREGRILCHLYGTTLYMLYPYFGIYYIMIIVDEFGARHNNNIDLSSKQNIYIADIDGEYYRSVSIEQFQTERNDPDPRTCHSLDGKNICIGSLEENDYLRSISTRKEFLYDTLNKLAIAITEGNIGRVKSIENFLHNNDLLDKTLIGELFSVAKCVTKNDLIILASEHMQADMLWYLLHKTNILHYFEKENTNTERENADRITAFRYAISSFNFNIVEMLYDYWCSTIHRARGNRHNENDVISELRTLGHLLEEARGECGDRLVVNQQMYVDVHCLIKFNDYQIDTYTKLKELKSNFDKSDNNSETERVRISVLEILSIYEKHSDVADIRLRKTLPEEEQSVHNLLADENSLYFKTLLFNMYEVYGRKLDFNVSLLLLHHLHILKQNLKAPEKSYQKIECALYYYILRISEDWRLYLAKNRRNIDMDVLGVHKGILTFMKSIYDPQKILHGPVLFFERRHFQKSLSDFKEMLDNINITNNMRRDKLPNDEINSLTLLPYMRDDYSLKRMVQYMEAALSVDIELDEEFGILIIERVVQVVGEMFKSTEESLHLSSTTKSLFQTSVSVDTLKNLETLRDNLSHAEGGQLTQRIEIEKNEKEVFNEVKADLEMIIQGIDAVLKIYRPFLDKSLIGKGLSLLCERIHELPNDAQFYGKSVQTIFHSYNLYGEHVYSMLEDNFLTGTWYGLGLSKQLFREVGSIQVNIEQLYIKKNMIKTRAMCIILGTLPRYCDIVENQLNAIKENNDLWKSMAHELPKFNQPLLDYPTRADTERVKNKILNLKKKGQPIDEDILQRVTLIRDDTDHWESIKEVLRFMLEEVQIFENNPFEIKKGRCSGHFHSYISKNPPNENAIEHVFQFLKMIKNEMERLVRTHAPDTSLKPSDPREFKGIKKLRTLLHVPKTDESKENTEENMKKKRTQMFESLINRINLMKKALEHPKQFPLSQHLLKYKSDQNFRIVIEMLLADIMSIFVACKINNLLIKESNLLTQINLRNVLDHGNPFVEVIADALDSQDFPTELISWAIRIVDDSPSIEALYSLYKENVDFETMQDNPRDKLTAEQEKTLKLFKKCSRWQDYLKLIPKSRKKYLQNKENPPESVTNDESLEKLLDAVKIKDVENVKVYASSISLDLLDRHGKAALHYAAMKGIVEIIEVLLDNGANVNVADGKCGKRPIHFACQNGHMAAITLLLNRGADTTVVDADNKLPLSYVTKKHEEIARKVARDLTVKMGLFLRALRT